jgi:hypothetical protein
MRTLLSIVSKEKPVKRACATISIVFCIVTIALSNYACDSSKDGKISKAEYERRVNWGKPKCTQFCQKVATMCADFLKEKKRTFDIEPCAKSCLDLFIKHPQQIAMRIYCSEIAKDCEQLRACNKCGELNCQPTTQPATKPTTTQPATKPTTTQPATQPATKPTTTQPITTQ